MANVGAIYELQNAVNINLTAEHLFHELTKNNLLRSFEYSQQIYTLLNDNNLPIPFTEISKIFNTSHEDHVEHTNQELFSCCKDMEAYLKTLPDTLSSQVDKPNFDQTAKTVETIENGVNETKQNINTRLKSVCEKKQELFCDDGVYTIIENARKRKGSEHINFKSIEKKLNLCSQDYLNKISENYNQLFESFSKNIDNIIKKVSLMKTDTNELQMNRMNKFAEKKIQELTTNKEEQSTFQNDSYQGSKQFINQGNFNMYYPMILSQIESYHATSANLPTRAMEVLSRFGREHQNTLSHNEIVSISHNILKMLKIDSHLIKAKSQDDKEKTEEFIVCNPEEVNPILFEPTKSKIVDQNGKQIEKPYTFSLNQDTIEKMKEGEGIVIGNDTVLENGKHTYQETMKLGEKQKILQKSKIETKQQ